MKSIVITIIMVTGLCLQTLAQAEQKLTVINYEQKAQQETDSMHVQLNLTAEQKDSVGMINKDYYHQIVLLHGQNLSLSQRIQQYTSAEQLWKNKLALHLSTSQYNQYFQGIEQSKIKWQQKMDSLKVARAGQ